MDDGSTDGSGAVCDDLARRDSRVRVIHQKNAGVSAARNAGLSESSGAYLTFVDSDDALVPHALETALEYLSCHDADVVTYGWMCHISGENRIESCSEPFSRQEDISEVLRQILMHYSAFGGGYPWNKLWRTERLLSEGDIPRFDPELYYFEDLEWVVRMLLRVRTIAVCPECLYDYRIYGGSVSRDPSKAEYRELGYHRSIEQIIADLAVLPELQQWFSMKYAPEIVNGIIGAVKNRQPMLRDYLSLRLREIKKALLRADVVSCNIKFRCRVLHILQLLHLL